MAYKNVTRVYDKATLNVRADEINMLKSKKNYKLVTTIIGRLKDLLRTDKNTIALSAPQIGYPYRIFCIRFSDGDIRGFVNPMIYKYGEKTHLSREMQLGHDSKTEYIVPRFDEVEMSFQTPVGNLESNLFQETLGEVVQQMDDLLNGVLLEDYGLEVLEGFDEASQEEREEIIKMYLEHLQNQHDDIAKELEDEKDNLKINEAIEFMEQAKLGNVQLEFEKKEPTTKEAKPKASKKTSKKDIMGDILHLSDWNNKA